MAKDSEYLQYDKQFLDLESTNGADEFASVAWRVGIDSNYQSNRDEFLKGAISATMRITDCSRAVSIDLYCSTVEDVEDRVRKLEVIREHCNKAIAALHEARDTLIEFQKNPNPKWDGKSEGGDED